MSRNIIISVLGTGFYEECNYFLHEESNSHKSRFIQESTYHLLNEKNSRIDKVIVLLTAQAKKENWLVESGERNNFRENKMVPYTGLKTIFESQDIPYQEVDIPDGSNQDEIWQIFDAVFDTIKDGDKVHLDITHSLRYLPMLLMVLVNYTRLFRKDVSFASITYGNYEQRSKETNKAPLMDITPLLTLQDWAIGAKNFVEYGKTEGIVEMVNRQIQSIDKKEKNQLINLNGKLKMLEGVFTTCRSKSIEAGTVFGEINAILKGMKNDTSIRPLQPVIEALTDKISRFSDKEDVINGLKAVEWCLQHNLLQQAITIGQENIISQLCSYYKLNKNSSMQRTFISQIIGVKKTDKENDEKEWGGELIKDLNRTRTFLQEPLIGKIASSYREITNLRNDINHGGTTGTRKPDDFEKNFIRFFNNCLDVLKETGLTYEINLNAH